MGLRMRKFWASVLLTSLLSACLGEAGGDGAPGQAPTQTAAARAVAPKSFPALEAEAVLAKGFQAIQEFALEEIELSSFALEGAKGLGSIDPNLVVMRDKNDFLMKLGDEAVFSARLPAQGDPRGWARLAVEGLIAARAKSPSLNEADAEAVYQAIFDAALARFDLHSRYAGAEETRRLKARRDGQAADGVKMPATVGLRLGDHVALIQIVGFNQQTFPSLDAKLSEAQATFGRQWRGLILDLRGNPGGILDQAVKTADLFLGPGRIVSARGRHPMSSVNHEASEGEAVAHGLPIVVLVDGGTASGAEVLAAALQDRGRAVVVGSATFGKGLVQTVTELPNGGEIDLSWSRLQAPSGYALQGLGVLPNVCTSSKAKRQGLAALAQGDALAADFAQWRTVGLGSQAARQKLRQICPPEPMAGEAEETALSLLADRALYAKALAPTGAYFGVKP